MTRRIKHVRPVKHVKAKHVKAAKHHHVGHVAKTKPHHGMTKTLASK